MCFSRRTYWREGESPEVRKDPVWDLFDREHEAERPQPVSDREREERSADDGRESILASTGS